MPNGTRSRRPSRAPEPLAALRQELVANLGGTLDGRNTPRQPASYEQVPCPALLCRVRRRFLQNSMLDRHLTPAIFLAFWMAMLRSETMKPWGRVSPESRSFNPTK